MSSLITFEGPVDVFLRRSLDNTDAERGSSGSLRLNLSFLRRIFLRRTLDTADAEPQSSDLLTLNLSFIDIMSGTALVPSVRRRIGPGAIPWRGSRRDEPIRLWSKDQPRRGGTNSVRFGAGDREAIPTPPVRQAEGPLAFLFRLGGERPTLRSGATSPFPSRSPGERGRRGFSAWACVEGFLRRGSAAMLLRSGWIQAGRP